MKKIIFLYILTVLVIETYGQKISISKLEINDYLKIEYPSDFKQNNYLIKEISRIKNSEKKKQVLKEIQFENKTISIKTDEEYLFSNKDFYFIQKFDSENYKKELIKYDIKSFARIASKEFSIEGKIEFVNKDGDFIFIEYGSGEAFGYFFYSNDFKLINSYKSYDHGFQFTDYEFKGKDLVIISQKKHAANSFKISVFKDFNLTKESELEYPNFSIGDIKSSNNNITVLLNSLDSKYGKVISLNKDLELKWEKQINERIYANKLIVSEINSKVILAFKNKIECLEAKGGNINWEKEINGNQTVSVLSKELFNNDSYLILNKADYKEETNEINNNILRIIDINTGNVLFEENNGSSKGKLKILKNEDFFYLIDKDKIQKYQISK